MTPEPVTRDELKDKLAETEVQKKIRENIYEIAIIGLIISSGTILAAMSRLSEANYMLIITGIATYAFGRIFNHVQGKE